ncbi:MAG: 3-dehydroquinate synthase [Opitutaceae bacterium]|jgi:3-dehydroquinate synthase
MEDFLKVNLGDRSYPIHFGTDLTSSLRAQIAGMQKEGRKVAVLTDENLMRCQAEALKPLLDPVPVISVSPGEESKSLENFGRVLDFLVANRLDRTSVLVAIGGGVIGDLGGFAAAAYLRGIDFIQVPTTLLAMVDSSVGGKTGINLHAGKNLAGAFHQPRSVTISTNFLRSLPAREFAAGSAEVIKYGLLGDAELFASLSKYPLKNDSPELPSVIRRCCAIKARVVEADERETAREGGRALLNLGHTFGHAVEQVAGYGVYLHGEAVAIGLCAAARLSQRLGAIDSAAVDGIDRVVAAHALPVRLREPLRYADLHAAMARDKKVRAGTLRFVVLQRVGEAVTRDNVAPALAEASFREVGAV